MTHNLISKGELVLFGTVGMSFFDDDGFTARQVITALEELEGDLTVRINSGGGLAFDGIAIYQALKRHDGKVTITIDGIAASAASAIAMAGDEIIMPTGSLMMIHNASGITLGTADDHLKTIEVLRKLDGQLASIYAARSGVELETLGDFMRDETWLTGEEAVELGLATQTADDEADQPAAFAYQLYNQAPDWLTGQFTSGDYMERFAREISAYVSRETATDSAAATPSHKEIKTMARTKTPAAPADGNEITVTLESVTTDHPEIVEALRAQGAQAERDRILGIEDNSMPGHDDLVAELKADGKTTPEQAAVRILKAEKAKGEDRLQAMKDGDKATKAPPASPMSDGTDAAPVYENDEEKWTAEYELDKKLAGEFANLADYLAFKKADAGGKIRQLGQ